MSPAVQQKFSEMDEETIIEKRKVREKLMDEAELDLFNKFKEIVFLGEDDVVTINQVADYYEVERKTINKIIQRNSCELKEDGIEVLKGENLRKIKDKLQNSTRKHLVTVYNKIKKVPYITVFPRRAVLRVGMLLQDSKVAKKIRNYLL